MKTKLLLSIAFAAACLISAAAEDKAVIIIATDGSQRQESITNLDRIELGDKGVTLKTTAGRTETFDYAAIDRILVNAEWDSVKEIASADEIAVWPAQTSGPVNISGLRAGQAVTISNLKGATVISAQATEGLTTVNLSAQPAGIYIVTAANHSVKIIKK